MTIERSDCLALMAGIAGTLDDPLTYSRRPARRTHS